jgi:hypothetical protein
MIQNVPVVGGLDVLSSNVIPVPETMWFPLFIVVVPVDVYDAKLNELPPTVNVPFNVKLFNVDSPVTARVPATAVLPFAAVTVNLFVLTATSPDTANPDAVIVPVVSEVHPVLDLNSKPLVVVLKMTKPVAGVPMAFRSVVVILGGKNPFVVELTSSIAEASAVLPSALIPTDCAIVANVVKIASKISSFFMRFDLFDNYN